MPCHHCVSGLVDKTQCESMMREKNWQIESDSLTNVSMKKDTRVGGLKIWVVFCLFSTRIYILMLAMTLLTVCQFWLNFLNIHKESWDTSYFSVLPTHPVKCFCVSACVCARVCISHKTYVRGFLFKCTWPGQKQTLLPSLTFSWLRLLPWHFPGVRSILI